MKHLSQTRKLFVIQALLLAAFLMLHTCCYAVDVETVNQLTEDPYTKCSTGTSDEITDVTGSADDLREVTQPENETGILDSALESPSTGSDLSENSVITADASVEALKEYILPVFETTDIHGHMVDSSDEGYLYRLAYIIDKVNDVRMLSGEMDVSRTVLLDTGDIYQGTALSSIQRGNCLRWAYAAASYDAVGIGNHEFDWGIEVSEDSDATMADYTIGDTKYSNDIPVVCSNLYLNGQRVEYGRDYIILNKTAYSSDGSSKNVKVAVIGCVEDYSSSVMTSKFTGLGFSIDSDYSKIDNLAAYLKNSGLCDTVIVLCHGDAETIAEKMGSDTKIDLVLGGDSHMKECGVTDGGLQYLEAYCYGKAYGYCELVFTAGEDEGCSFEEVRNAKLYEVENTELLINNAENTDELDAGIIEISDNALSESNELMSRVIGYITDDADNYYVWDDNVGNCNMANWMGKMMRSIGNSDVAFINGGGIRTGIFLEESSDRKNITEGDIYNIFPFENQVYTFEMTYPELLKILDYAVDGEHNILFKFVSGIDCYYDSDNNITGIIKDGKLIYNGREWSDTVTGKTIRVSVADFIAMSSRPTTDGRNNPLLELYAQGLYEIAPDIDRDSAIRILEEESDNNNGHLLFDTDDHFICGAYDSYYDSTFVKYSDSSDSGSRAAATGDENYIWLYVALLTAAAALCAGMVVTGQHDRSFRHHE